MTQSYCENIKNDGKYLAKLSLWGIIVISGIGIWDSPALYAAPIAKKGTHNTQDHRVHGTREALGNFQKNQRNQRNQYFIHDSVHMRSGSTHIQLSKKQVHSHHSGHAGSEMNRVPRNRLIDGTIQLSQYSSRIRMFDAQQYMRHFAGKKDYHSIAVRAALSRLGAPYMWGSAGPNAFDCSGLVVWSYKHSGITLPRSTWGQISVGKPVHSLTELQPADLVITDGGGHVGMYIGHGMMVHAPDTGDRVKIVPVTSLSIYSMRHI